MEKQAMTTWRSVKLGVPIRVVPRNGAVLEKASISRRKTLKAWNSTIPVQALRLNDAGAFFWCLLMVTLCVVCHVSPVAANQAKSRLGTNLDSLGAEAPAELAPVTLDGIVLFSVRGVSSYPAAERAAQTSAAIRRIAGDSSVNPDSLTIVDEGSITRIMAGSTRIKAVIDADAEIEGVSRSELALATVDRIRTAITQYREERSPEYLLVAVAQTLAATAALALVLALVLWIARRLDRSLASRLEEGLRTLGAESMQAGSSSRAGKMVQGAIRTSRTTLVLVSIVTYLHLVFGLFPWTRPLHAGLAEWLVGPLRTMGHGILEQIPDLIFLAILIVILRWFLGLVRLFFEAIERGDISFTSFEAQWALPTFKIVRVVVLAFGVVVAYPYIPGSGSQAFKGISIFAGVLLSLGSSSVIGNIVAGFSVLYRKAFGIGDLVRIGDSVGTVVDIRQLVTHLRSLKNELLVIPNSRILTETVTNYSSLARSRGLILHTTVGIGYETPWRQVKAMLLTAAARTPGLLSDPPPFVLETGLGDFAISYELNAYCDEPKHMVQLYTKLHENILDVFNEYGVAIMTPAYVSDTDDPKLVPHERWFAAPATTPGDSDVERTSAATAFATPDNEERT